MYDSTICVSTRNKHTHTTAHKHKDSQSHTAGKNGFFYRSSLSLCMPWCPKHCVSLCWVSGYLQSGLPASPRF